VGFSVPGRAAGWEYGLSRSLASSLHPLPWLGPAQLSYTNAAGAGSAARAAFRAQRSHWGTFVAFF